MKSVTQNHLKQERTNHGPVLVLGGDKNGSAQHLPPTPYGKEESSAREKKIIRLKWRKSRLPTPYKRTFEGENSEKGVLTSCLKGICELRLTERGCCSD
jgi:hypothetical protein